MVSESTDERITPEFGREELGYAEHMARYFFADQFVKDKIVLDIACGTGYGSLHLLRSGAKKVIGVDISKEAIDYAKSKYQKRGIKFLQGNAENIPLESGASDVIVSIETIEHLKNPEKFLKEIKRVLKKDGLVIISTPNVLVYPKGNIFHKKEFAPKELKTLLLKYFKNLKIYYQHSVLSSYVLSEKSLSKDYKEIRIRNLKLAKMAKDKNLFLLGVMSNGRLPETTESTVLFNDRKIKMLEKELHELHEIFSSRGWKIISFLHDIRIKIPLLKDI